MPTTQANQRLTGDLKPTAQDGQEPMRATAGRAGAQTHEPRTGLTGLAAALESAKAAAERLEAKTIAAAKTTDRSIREHPYQTIGLAFGLGLLIGILVTRR